MEQMTLFQIKIACEAYGYRYNSATGTCNSYNFNTKFSIENLTIYLIIQVVVQTENGTKNTILINGQENTNKRR